MKIVHLHAENFKRIAVVDVTPKGDVIQISGPNGSGKSSVLDSIMALIGGKDACPDEPVRHGERKAVIYADLGGRYMVKRTFTPDGKTSLTIESSEGARYGSPQKLLDDFLGDLSFDPLEFARMKPRDQYETIRTIAGIGNEIDRLDARHKEAYEERASWNRQAKEAEAAAAAIEVPSDLPAERLNMAAMAEEMEAATQHNASIMDASRKRAAMEQELASLEASNYLATSVQTEEFEIAKSRASLDQEISEINTQIEALNAKKQRLIAQHSRDIESIQVATRKRNREHEAKVTNLRQILATSTAPAAPIDILEIKERMANAEYYNSGIANRERRAELEARADSCKEMSKTLTASMERMQQERQNIIASSKLPVPGLELIDGGVRYNGVPFSQASDAERLRVSCAIAMAQNNKLRVIRVKDGSLLDANGMKILADMARERDYQVWVEVVDESKLVGVVMQEGRVIADMQDASRAESARSAAN